MIPDKPLSIKDFNEHSSELGRIFYILDNINSLLKNSKEGSLTISVSGDWGSGKTTILNLISSYYRDYCGFPVVFFEAWKHQNDENIFASMLLEIAEQCGLNAKDKKALRHVANALKATAVLTSEIFLKQLVNIGISDISRAFSIVEKDQEKLLSGYKRRISELGKYISRIRDSWNPNKKAQCASKNDEKAIWHELSNEDAFPEAPDDKFFVLVIDDLDRLIPEKAFEMIEQLRFYFDIDKTLIIMGINDIVINRHVLDKYFHHVYDPGSTEKNFRFKNGEKFLDKIFEWTYEVPFSDLNEIHLRGINNESPQHKDIIKSFLSSLPEPLPHRKWIKILNRIEAGLRTEGDVRTVIATSVLLELFPEFELNNRRHPNVLPEILKMKIEDIHKILDSEDRDNLNWIMIKTLQSDTTYNEFPLSVLEKVLKLLKEEV